MAWKNAGNRHSDKEKFRSDLNRPESCEMSEPPSKALRKSGDFHAEYEGSVLFTCIFGHPNVADAGEMDHSAVALISFVVPAATWWNPLMMSTRGDFPGWGAHRASLYLLTLSNDIFRRST
jgi:hypothetical protein